MGHLYLLLFLCLFPWKFKLFWNNLLPRHGIQHLRIWQKHTLHLKCSRLQLLSCNFPTLSMKIHIIFSNIPFKNCPSRPACSGVAGYKYPWNTLAFLVFQLKILGVILMLVVIASTIKRTFSATFPFKLMFLKFLKN